MKQQVPAPGAVAPDQLEINKELVISASHISKELAGSMFGGSNDDFGYDVVSHGFVVYVADAHLHDYCNPTLQALATLAQTNDCKWLRLDADGPVLPGYPTFDW